MAAKRKPWWHYLRGPRGHRGFPGPTGLGFNHLLYNEAIKELNERVAELERKLAGPHDREDAAVLGRNKQ